MSKKEKNDFDVSIVDELDEITAILSYLSDSTLSIFTCEKPPLTKTTHGTSLIFSSIIERLENIRGKIDLKCKTRNR